jgi:hypothetical protein
MVRRDGAEVRKERITEIGRLVLALLNKSEKGEILLEKTVSVLAYEKGLRKERVKEYLGILADLDRFVLDVEGDKIRSVVEEEETLNE